MFIDINPENIDPRKISEVVDCLNNDGVIIFPTDSVYSMGCSLKSSKALKRLYKIKGVKPEKANFSLLCHSISSLSEYTKHVSRPVFRVINRSLPGPYTFILKGSSQIPKLFTSSKKTVGIRVPDNAITLSIIEQLNCPLVGTSVHSEDDILEYASDPNQIYERYEDTADLIVDGGFGRLHGTTVVDCSDGDIDILREGLGQTEDW